MKKAMTFSEVLLFSNPNRKRSKTHHKLQIIEKSIDFGELEKFVANLYKSNKATGGRPPIHIHTKIKMLFLQYLYNMTDEQLEDSLLANFDFQEFVNISVHEDVPDFTSHWRLKERLINTNNLDKLLAMIQGQLKQKGIGLQQGSISIIDATIISSSNRPLSNQERKDLTDKPSSQKDTDASSTEKNGTKYYGYKGHINVDGETKLIQKATFTSAKEHDIRQFEKVLTGEEKEVYGDKAYRSKDLEKKARLVNVKYKVLRKAYKNQALSLESIETNKQWSKVRARVEHAFAYIKNKLHYTQARAKNKLRNELAFQMNVVMYNIFRMNYLLQKQVS